MSNTVYEILAACDACEICVPLCPTGSIFFVDPKFAIDVDTCNGCGVCAEVCPQSAVKPRETAAETKAP